MNYIVKATICSTRATGPGQQQQGAAFIRDSRQEQWHGEDPLSHQTCVTSPPLIFGGLLITPCGDIHTHSSLLLLSAQIPSSGHELETFGTQPRRGRVSRHFYILYFKEKRDAVTSINTNTQALEDVIAKSVQQSSQHSRAALCNRNIMKAMRPEIL